MLRTKQTLKNRAAQFTGISIAYSSAIASLNSLYASEEQVLFQQLSEGLTKGYTFLDGQGTLWLVSDQMPILVHEL